MTPPGTAANAALFEPAHLGRLELKNRFAMAPMTRAFAQHGIPGADVAAYYARRAGSVGLVITEGVLLDVLSAGRPQGVPWLGAPGAVDAWRRVVSAVHAADGRILCQLWHRGPGAEREVALSPSGLDAWSSTLNGPMTTTDIDDVIASYVRAATDAAAAGFDGVEIHGGHGYLIDAFLWTGTNLRDDGYGGAPAARARLAAEVVSAVRDATGPDFVISFRFSQWKAALYGARIAESPGELEGLLTPIAAAGVDLLHASTRRHWEPAFDGSPRTLSGWARALTGVPTIAVGSVGNDPSNVRVGEVDSATNDKRISTEIARSSELFAAGEFDLLAVGRALLANHDWVRRARESHADPVRSFSHELAERELF